MVKMHLRRLPPPAGASHGWPPVYCGKSVGWKWSTYSFAYIDAYPGECEVCLRVWRTERALREERQWQRWHILPKRKTP